MTSEHLGFRIYSYCFNDPLDTPVHVLYHSVHRIPYFDRMSKYTLNGDPLRTDNYHHHRQLTFNQNVFVVWHVVAVCWQNIEIHRVRACVCARYRWDGNIIMLARQMAAQPNEELHATDRGVRNAVLLVNGEGERWRGTTTCNTAVIVRAHQHWDVIVRTTTKIVIKHKNSAYAFDDKVLTAKIKGKSAKERITWAT